MRFEVFRCVNPAPDAGCAEPRSCYATPDWQRSGPRYDPVQIKDADEGAWWGRLLAVVRYTDLRRRRHELCCVRHYQLVDQSRPRDRLFDLPHVYADEQCQFVAADAIDGLVQLKPDFLAPAGGPLRFFVLPGPRERAQRVVIVKDKK